MINDAEGVPLWGNGMDRKVAHIHRMDEYDEVRKNLRYWLSRPPEERLAAVDELRRQAYGNPQPIQRTVRVVRMNQDAADIEALGQ